MRRCTANFPGPSHGPGKQIRIVVGVRFQADVARSLNQVGTLWRPQLGTVQR